MNETIREARQLVREAEARIQAVFNEQMRVLNDAGLSVIDIDVPMIDASTSSQPFKMIVGQVRIKVTL